MDIDTAAESGTLKVLSEILEADPSLLRVKNSLGDEPIHTAAHQRRVKIVEYLLQKGADINARGDHGRTPLLIAVHLVAKPLTKLLLKNNADTRIADDLGSTPLYLAAATGDKAMFTILSKHGAAKDLNSAMVIDGPGYVLSQLQADPGILKELQHPGNLLLEAIRLQDSGLTTFLMEQGILIKEANNSGKPPGDGTRLDAQMLVKHLLDQGVDCNAKVSGLFPLHHAISYKAKEIVQIFLDHGASVEIKDNCNSPLLKFSETYGATPEIVQMLKDAGATA